MLYNLYYSVFSNCFELFIDFGAKNNLLNKYA